MKKISPLNSVVVVTMIFAAIWPAAAMAAPAPIPPAQVGSDSIAAPAEQTGPTIVSQPVAPADTAGLPPAPTAKAGVETKQPIEIPSPRRARPKVQDGKSDPLVQDQMGAVDMPSPIANFEGVSNLDGVYPPDTNGEAGPNHYVEMVNEHMAVYNKNGTLLYGPFLPGDLWPSGDPCHNNDGDPVTLYDQLANRWLISQFSLPNYPNGPFYECIAVSKTGTPTNNPNGWYPYTFLVNANKMDDYPKLAVWPDAYYMTANQFNAGSLTWGGVGIWAFDRARMLNGQVTTFQYVDLGSISLDFGGILPADLDGNTPPPAGSPAYFVEVDDSTWIPPNDALRLWRFHVDWVNPANSTFGVSGQPNAVITTAPWTPLPCIGSCRAAIPQPGTSQRLDSLGDRLMFRLVYRNFGNHEALTVNHTVLADGADRAGVRWYELRNPGSSPTIYQQGTYAPADGLYRWMGSVAMDHVGNMALGYSVSSSSVYPSIRYTGRLATDPLGTLPQAEVEVIAGTGSQTGSAARWGDYTDMTIDPVDDCTFWYANEYVQTTGSANWQTHIASFKFPNCSLGPQGTLTGTITRANNSNPIVGAVIQATAGITQSGATTSGPGGNYTINLPVGAYVVTATAYGYLPAIVSGVIITENATTTRNFALTPAPTYIVSGVVKDAVTGWPLYAGIAIDGYPGDPIWTNPASGQYSITLVAGTTYNFHVGTFSSGYLVTNRSVGPLSSNQVQNFNLNVNQATCTAPGYSFVVSGFQETFDSVTPPALPAGWAKVVVTNTTTPPDWFTNVGTRHPSGVTAHSAPNLVLFNSFSSGAGAAARLYYIPTINLNTVPTTTLSLWMYHETGFSSRDDQVQVQVSTDGGTSWQNVGAPISRYTGNTGWAQHTVSLNAYAGQTIKLGFLGISAFGNDVHLDDLLLGVSPCLPKSGGLVVGTVNDANTLADLDGATVQNQAGYSATTVPTPLDPNVGDGFYTLYSPSGSQVFTATLNKYAPGIALVSVPLSSTVRQDFSLHSGLLSYAPASIDVSFMAGTSTTRPVTLTNSGDVATQYEILELDKGAVPFGPIEKPVAAVEPFELDSERDALDLELPDPPNAPPYAAGDIIQSWMPAGVTTPWGIAYDSNDSSVWVSSPAPAWGGTNQIFEFSPAGGHTGRSHAYTWNPENGPADAAYNWNTSRLWVMNVNTGVANCLYEIDPATGPTGDKICPGGGTGFSISQRGVAYDPATDTYFAGGWNDSMVYRFKPDGTILNSKNVGLAIAGLAYNPKTGHVFVVDSVAASKFYVLDANNNYNLLGQFIVTGFTGGAGLEIDCDGNLWAVDQSSGKVYQISSGETASLCSQEVPWLSTAPVSGTVTSSAAQVVSVTLDSAAVDPGVYKAQLKFKHNTPYNVSNLPITMTVTVPPTSGKLTGNVSTLGYCDASPAPLMGITVTIASAANTWQVLTDKDGNYRQWLDQSYNPLTVTVSPPGQEAGQASGVTVSGLGTTTQDFALRWLQPCVSTTPGAYTITLNLSQATNRTLKLNNNGAASATYSLTEQLVSAPLSAVNIPASDGNFPHGTAAASIKRAPQAAGQSGSGDNPLALLAATPAYALDLSPNTLNRFPDLAAPGAWNTIGSIGADFIPAADFLNGDFTMMYALDDDTKQLLIINTATAARTVVGSAATTGGESWTGLTASTSGVVYASGTTCSTSSLYTINPATGVATRIGAITNSSCVIDLAIDTSGNLYGVDIIADTLIKINTSTGAGAVVGSIGFDANYAQGMDFDNATGILYLAAYNNSTSAGQLRTVSTSTGNSTLVGNFPGNTEVDGLSIATGSAGDVPWLTENPISGTIPADAFQSVTLGFDANAVPVPGAYKANLDVNSNDPVNAQRQSAMTMIVSAPANWGVLTGMVSSTGHCDIEMRPLGDAQLVLRGTSGPTRTVTTNDNGQYRIWLNALTSPYTLTAAAAQHQPAGPITGIVINQLGTVTNQDLSLRSSEPCVKNSPNGIAVTVPWHGTLTKTLTLSNTGGASSPFTITEQTGGFIPMRPAASALSGGPDAFGYTFKDSNAFGGPTYAWIDATNGTTITLPGDDDEANITLPFAFKYYTTTATTLRAGKNGATLYNATTGDVSFNNVAMSSAPNNLIALLWDDQGAGGNVYWKVVGSAPNRKAVIEWYNVPRFTNVGAATYEMVLMENGNILYQYQDVDYGNVSYDGGASATVGIRGYGAANSLQYSFNTAALTNSLAICFAYPGLAADCSGATMDVVDWVSENPTTGSLAADGGVQAVNVAFNSNAPDITQPGTYYAKLRVNNDDATRSDFSVPITMTVLPTTTQAKVNGTVNSLGYCAVNPAPLNNASVLLQGTGGYSFTVNTNASGYYQWWLDAAQGPLTITVSAPEHLSSSASSVAVTSQQTTTVNFNLRWYRPCQGVTPSSLSANLELGSSTATSLTLGNTGPATLTFSLKEVDRGFSPVAPSSADVLVVNDGATNDANVGAFTVTLNALGYTYDVTNSSPSTGIPVNLLNYKYVLYAGYPSAGAEDNQLMAYLDAGGSLLVSDNDFGYFRNGSTIYQTYFEAAYGTDAGSDGAINGVDIMNSITIDISSDPFPDSFTLAGPQAVGIFENTAPRTGLAGSRIARNAYKAIYFAWDYQYTGGSSITATAKVNILQRALDWLTPADVLWLSENPTAANVNPNVGQQVVNVTFDASAASVTQPGNYYASLFVLSNDPQRSTLSIPVTMTVTAPATWAKFNGAVSSQGACDMNDSPLNNALVFVETRVGLTYTLRTNAAGYYQVWTAAANGPLTLTVSAPNYLPKVVTGITATGGTTTTTDVKLRLNAPCQSSAPAAMSVSQYVSEQTTHTLTISNSGAAQLNWIIEELNAGVQAPSAANATRLPSYHAITEPKVEESPQADVVQDGSFEAAVTGNSPYWYEYSSNFGTPLCRAASCGTGGGTAGPHTGSWWAWFGGHTGSPEISYVTQTVVISSGTAALNFWLFIGHVGDGANDYLRVLIDSTPVFTATKNTPGYASYALVSLDVSRFANSAAHRLRFESQTNDATTPTNFSMDDISLDVSGPNCQPDVLPWVAVSPISGTTAADSASPVNVVFNSASLTAGAYTGTLCLRSNDLLSPFVEVPISLTVVQKYGVDVAPHAAAKSGDPSNVVTYTMRVTNTGAVSDTFSLSLSGNTWTTQLSSAHIGVPAGGGLPVTVKVTVPANAAPNAADTVTVTAISQGDAAQRDATRLTTTANTVYAMDMWSPAVILMGDRGKSVTYTLYLSNTGNITAAFTFAAYSNSWPMHLPGNTVIGPHNSALVSVIVDIPVGAVGGQFDSAAVKARLIEYPTSEQVLVLTTFVKNATVYLPLLRR